MYTQATSKNQKSVAEERKTSKHIKRKKNKKIHEKPEYEKNVENVYFEDKFRDKASNSINTLYSSVRPYYYIKINSLGFVPYKKSKKNSYKRYYVKNIDHIEKNKKKDTVIKKESTTNSSKEEQCIPSWYIKLEELQKSKTKEYNEKLTNNPNDIQLWIEYMEFQVYLYLPRNT